MSIYRIKAVVEKIEWKNKKGYVHLKGVAGYQWCSSAHKEKVFNVLESLDANPNKILDKLIIQIETATNLPNSCLISILTHSFCQNFPFLFELCDSQEVVGMKNAQDETNKVSVYKIYSISKPGVD